MPFQRFPDLDLEGKRVFIRASLNVPQDDAAIAEDGITRVNSYISTGGGALREILEGKVLPAVEVLEQRAD